MGRKITPAWAAANLMQVLWSIIFAQEAIWLSFVAIFGIWISLALVLRAQLQVFAQRGGTYQLTGPFWLLSLPFQVHLGWITAATVLNVNLGVVKSRGDKPEILLAVAVCSLVVLSLAALLASRHSSTVCFVISYAVGAISAELKSPKSSITVWAPALVTSSLSDACEFLSVAFAVATLLNLARFATKPAKMTTKQFGSNEAGTPYFEYSERPSELQVIER